MSELIRKTLTGFDVKASKEDDRTLKFIASDENVVDRDMEVVKVSGLDTKEYTNNPVVLWAHNHTTPPIGKTTKVYKRDGKLHADIKFAEMEEHSLADTIYKLLKGKYLNAVSIGFLPKPEKDAIEYPQKTGGPWRIFHKTKLMEISVVGVPSNPNALQQSKEIKKALEDKVVCELELDELIENMKEMLDTEEKSDVIYGINEDTPEDDVKDDAEASLEAAEKDAEELSEKTETIEITNYIYKCACCGEEQKVVCEKCEKDNYFDELILELRTEKSQRDSFEDEMIETLRKMKDEVKDTLNNK